jgi:ABC-type Fe3+-siderophore transport system permease subunit
MDLVWLVYLISLLDNIVPLAGVILSITGTALIIGLIYLSEHTPSRYDNNAEREWKAIKHAGAKKLVKKLWITVIISAVVLVIVPSKKTAYIMIGAYAAQQLAQNDDVKTIGGKVYSIITNELDFYLEKSLPKKKD